MFKCQKWFKIARKFSKKCLDASTTSLSCSIKTVTYKPTITYHLPIYFWQKPFAEIHPHVEQVKLCTSLVQTVNHLGRLVQTIWFSYSHNHLNRQLLARYSTHQYVVCNIRTLPHADRQLDHTDCFKDYNCVLEVFQYYLLQSTFYKQCLNIYIYIFINSIVILYVM